MLTSPMSTSLMASPTDGQRKHVRCSSYLRDYLSHMPDELLLSIISRLPLKEAARTSTLARRWRYLWPHSVYDLDFGAYSERILRYLSQDNDRAIKAARVGYIRWVNKLLGLHRCTTIQRLRVRFFLDKSSSSDIDAWLQFALAKGVKSLELDLRMSCGFFHSNCYPFPNICDLIQVAERRLPSSSFTSLETLQLVSVDISGQVLEHFISNCPSLQLLRVENSNGLIDLNVNGPSISLKHLELRACRNMKNLAIRAPSLLCFAYLGPEINIVVEDLSHLVKLHSEISWTVAREIIPLQSCFTHLEELVLHERAQGLERIRSPISFPSLRKLVLDILAYDVQSLAMCSASLINAAPNLHEFRLELTWGKAQGEKRLRIKGEEEPHQCLKTVEFIGFAGGTADVELALYFLRIGISLERMVIDPHRPFVEKEMARERAKELKAKLSPQTTLVIL